MIEFDIEKMLFNIPAGEHTITNIKRLLNLHPEVKFVSYSGVDLGGHSTDEKIPIKLFLGDIKNCLTNGVQTDGSSVALPMIAELSNARVDIIPDSDVNWYIEYNYGNIDYECGLPIGTLRIPSFLRHNGEKMVGSRMFLKHALDRYNKELLETLEGCPYVFNYTDGVRSASSIKEIRSTSATELEFWVKTPDDRADRDQLYTSQELKEQYWKRTIGPVNTALEETLVILDKYGFDVEMGHKEVGGIRAKMGNSGQYDHIMEQLEIDWKYTNPMQAADNEIQVKHIVRDIFRKNNLEVTFLAKPMNGVAGSGEHTHLCTMAKLKNGNLVNLFEPKDRTNEFLSPIGFGALCGLLKNYEVLNPFVSSTNDAFKRLKPGYEAPVCIVTSLGKDCSTPSRNRTVLAGLIRDMDKPLATRFELRAPNPHSNTYMVIGASYLSMLDGIKAALKNEKTPKDLEKSISKKYGVEDFYLDTEREYRCETDIFKNYTEEERAKLFGKAPSTVWDNFSAFEKYSDKLEVITNGDEVVKLIIESYREQMLSKWRTELHDRLIPNTMDFVRSCYRRHLDKYASDYDIMNWRQIERLRKDIGKDYIDQKSLLTQAKEALDKEDYDEASKIEVKIEIKAEELRELYIEYKKNLF